MKRVISGLAVMLMAGTAMAQLPPDAVMLDKVKVPQVQKSHEFCPVHLVPADASIATWEYEGVTYGGDKASCESDFAENPDGFAEQADKKRWENNFSTALSEIWCPVTDEISPGGNIKWEMLGLKWESCCQFCNDTKSDEDFPRALERLKKRAAKAYELTGAHYTEGASSPVEGAIDLGGPIMEATHVEMAKAETGPAYMDGRELKATYKGGIAEIFDNRCLDCHHQGGQAPMPFMTHGAIRKWTKNMKTVLTQRTMPPWPPGVSGHFSNSKRLSQKELDLLVEWIDAKYPLGDEEYTPSGRWKAEWAIGEPDHVFDMGSYTIPEDDTDVVKEYEIATDFDGDRLIVSAQIKPTDTFFIFGIDAGPLGAYHVGNGVIKLPEGTAYLLKKGETVKVRVFYTKEEGWEEFDDATKLAIVFAKDPSSITKHIMRDRMANDNFSIPAGSDNTEISAEFKFAANGTLYALNPVMRLRGKSVKYTISFPNGKEEELVNIGHFDAAWHFRYALAEPIEAPRGTVVKMTAVYDNSDMNAQNPDPSVEVKAGPGGELLEGWIEYSLN